MLSAVSKVQEKEVKYELAGASRIMMQHAGMTTAGGNSSGLLASKDRLLRRARRGWANYCEFKRGHS